MGYDVDNFSKKAREFAEIARFEIELAKLKILVGLAGESFRILKAPPKSEDETYDTGYRPDTIVKLGMIALAFNLFVRNVAETLGVVKMPESGGKKPEGGGFWENAKKHFRHAAIPAIMAYVRGARKVEQETRNLDRFAGIEQGEKGRQMTRTMFILAIAVPIAAAAIIVGFLANEIKQSQEKKLQEKVAPAPRKAAGVEMHKNDALYQMAFARPLPKSTFVVAQKPASKARQIVG